jgi:RNA polymerase sigma-70 factor (ECF subfamily)
MAGEGSRFPQTMWKRLRQAASQKTTAVNEFVNSYRSPLRAFIAASGVPEREVEDLLQEVFMELFQKKLLEAADANRGRFRSFLLGVTKNVLRNWKRKASADKRSSSAPHVSLDERFGPDDDAKLSDLLAAPRQDETFDSLWMEHLVRRSLDRLKAECEEKKLRYHEALREFLQQDVSYSEIAARMKLSEHQIRNYIHRGRKKLVEGIRAEIAAYCSSAEEFEDEVRYLSRFFDESV